MDKNSERHRKAVKPATDLSTFVDKHKGKKGFVLGAGPTLGLLDLSGLSNYPVFSVNSSILALPWEEPGEALDRFWISTDMLCMQWTYFWKKVIKVECTRVVRNSWSRNMDRCKGVKFNYYNPRRTNSLPKSRTDGLFGGSSILSATDLALITGCKEVYLLGVDHRMLHGKSHFWQSWPKSEQPIRDGKGGSYFPCQKQQSRVFKSNFNAFKVMDKWATHLGAKIYNCSNISKIDTFPQISLQEALDR